MKIALVHDFLLTFGGAERVLQSLAKMYPEAPIYTLLSDPEVTMKYFSGRDIRPSFLQKFPQWLRKRHRFLLPFYPMAVETFDLRDFDLVISSSGAWSKGIVTRLHTRHLAYLHSPMRFAWDSGERYLKDEKPGRKYRFVARLVLSYLRIWDREAAERPDVLVANSRYTLERIKKYYRREATLVYPPGSVLLEGPRTMEMDTVKRDYFLVVARLTKSKRVEMVIEAFNKLGFPLVIVGTGPEEKALRALVAKNITFRGRVNDQELAQLYRGARALIQPSEEDFGMVAVEALLFETPVIAFGRGGACEIVTPGVTGELYDAETPEVLADGIRRFIEHESGYSKESMRATAGRFGREAFEAGIREAVEKLQNKK